MAQAIPLMPVDMIKRLKDQNRFSHSILWKERVSEISFIPCVKQDFFILLTAADYAENCGSCNLGHSKFATRLCSTTPEGIAALPLTGKTVHSTQSSQLFVSYLWRCISR
jgi:hypothetical protein